MPSWVRSFIFVLSEKVAATTVGSIHWKRQRSSEREDAVLEGGGSGLRVYQWIQLGRVGKESALPYSSILVESEAIICSRSFRASVSHWGIA